MFITETSEFWNFNIGHVFDACLVILAGMAYKVSRTHDVNEAKSKREEMIELQVKMHIENKERLNVLHDFHDIQLEINRKRDEQIALLREQTASISQMAAGLDKRVQLMENRRIGS